jgi:predicted ATPase/DNA-binding CsgD family transcriptional regulator
VTILGPGGIGKTRLGIQVAADLGTNFDDGVYFIPLAAVLSVDYLVPAIADVLRFAFWGSGEPRQQLLDYLREQRVMLVIDNFEHLLSGVDLLVDILATAPEVKMLVTSRERLNIRDEWLLDIQGLDYPHDETNGAVEDYSAVQLFLQSARRVKADFQLTQANQSNVIRVCRLVEGIPLAIELAASWVRALSCQAIGEEIERNLDFLATSLHDAPEKHRSMRAVFAHSYDLLTAQQQQVFGKLTVFRGGFRREAAHSVAGASLATLAALVDKSLLRVNAEGRYDMHELLRQYGEEQLNASGDAAQLSDLHSEYYTNFVAAHVEIHGGNQVKAVIDLESELENIRAAWQWAIDHGKVEAIQRSAHALHMFYQFRSRYLEAAEAFAKALESLGRLEPTEQQQYVLALVLVDLGWFYLRLGQIEDARSVLERSQTIFEALQVPPPAVAATEPLAALSIVTVVLGDYTKAVQIGEQAYQACQARGDTGNLISCSLALASAFMAQGNYETARQVAQRGCGYAQELGHDYLNAYCLNLLGNATQALGDYDEARQHYQTSYALREKFNDPEGMAVALNHLGKLAWAEGNYAEAKLHYQRSLGLYQNIGDKGGLAGALLGLGLADCKLEDDHSARQHFYGALHTALEARLMPLVMTVIVSIVELFPESWSQALAIELLILVIDHPASDYETRERAQHLLTKYQIAPNHLAEIRQQVNFNISTSALLIELRKPVETSSLARDSHVDDWQLLDPLTEREREVLRLIADGLSNHEIASKLFISIGTVKWYCSQIYDKLGVQSRTQAILRAQQLKLLS